MAVLGTTAALVCGCVLLASGAYVRRAGYFSRAPVSVAEAASLVGCGTSCSRQTEPGCVGFSYAANNSCELFSDMCVSEAPAAGGRPIGYTWKDPEVTPPEVTPCPSGWLFFRDSCYLRQSATLSWFDARTACQSHSACTDLVSPNDQVEVAWLLHHPSRPTHTEYIGLRRHDGALVNVDDTSPSDQLLLEESSADLCFHLRNSRQTNNIEVRECTTNLSGYICESALLCQTRSPCPAGWLGLDDYCYHYVSTANTWQGADQHCAALQTGARLAPIINMNTWEILRQSFSPTTNVFVGISDMASEGSFQSVDGSSWSITWGSGEPSNGGGIEDCVELGPTTANDLACTDTRPSICRLPRGTC